MILMVFWAYVLNNLVSGPSGVMRGVHKTSLLKGAYRLYMSSFLTIAKTARYLPKGSLGSLFASFQISGGLNTDSK